MADKYFIYGSLRRGMYNYERMRIKDCAVFKGLAVLRGYKLYSLGGYPAVAKSDSMNDIVVGELFEFTDKACENSIARMEKGAGYDKESEVIILEGGAEEKAFVYAMKSKDLLRMKRLKHAKVLEHGDWLKENVYGKEGSRCQTK